MDRIIKFRRSKAFPEVVFSYQIPNRLLVEEDGRVNLYGGTIYESSQRMEKAIKPMKSYSRLDNAKLALKKMALQLNK